MSDEMKVYNWCLEIEKRRVEISLIKQVLNRVCEVERELTRRACWYLILASNDHGLMSCETEHGEPYNRRHDADYADLRMRHNEGYYSHACQKCKAVDEWDGTYCQSCHDMIGQAKKIPVLKKEIGALRGSITRLMRAKIQRGNT